VLPFDLHVLSMPPAFNLSQDQTLQFKVFGHFEGDQAFRDEEQSISQNANNYCFRFDVIAYIGIHWHTLP
jgi:hypothetical protein